MKPISTKMHGILDYASVGAMLLVPRLLRWNKPATNLLTGAAITTAAYSLLTDYELGARKVLPMKAHLALDAVQGIALGAAPFAFKSLSSSTANKSPLSTDIDDPSRKRELIGLLAISAIEGLIVLGSQTKPQRKNILSRLLNR